MLLDANDWFEQHVQFPNDKNVRVSIAGLATCEFSEYETQPSIINFLRHVPHHALKMRIKKRNRQGDLISDTQFQLVGITENFSIRGTEASPTDYIYEAGQFPISTLINLSEFHKEQFFKTPRPSDLPTPEPTHLTLHDCAFYVSKLTDYKYEIKLGNIVKSPPIKHGEILSGYINVTGESLLILGDISQKLNMKENGQSFTYEIMFMNLCIDEVACRREMGSDGSDVKYLYDILRPQKNANKKLKLYKVTKDHKGKEIKSGNVAACLPGGTKPCSSC
jgi:hypothetical protein